MHLGNMAVYKVHKVHDMVIAMKEFLFDVEVKFFGIRYENDDECHYSLFVADCNSRRGSCAVLSEVWALVHELS